MVKWLNARGIMILIKWKQVNREVPSSNPADIIYHFSIFHVISYVTKTSIYIVFIYQLAIQTMVVSSVYISKLICQFRINLYQVNETELWLEVNREKQFVNYWQTSRLTIKRVIRAGRVRASPLWNVHYFTCYVQRIHHQRVLRHWSYFK